MATPIYSTVPIKPFRTYVLVFQIYSPFNCWMESNSIGLKLDFLKILFAIAAIYLCRAAAKGVPERIGSAAILFSPYKRLCRKLRLRGIITVAPGSYYLPPPIGSTCPGPRIGERNLRSKNMEFLTALASELCIGKHINTTFSRLPA